MSEIKMAARRFAVETDQWVDEVVERAKASGQPLSRILGIMPLAIRLRLDNWWMDQGRDFDDPEFEVARAAFDNTLSRLYPPAGKEGGA